MRVYSFKNITLLVNGVEITGFADGDDVLTASRRVDSASDLIGADGKMMVSLSADRSGEFTFRLQQVSGSNKYLNALLNLQEGIDTFVPVNVMCQDTYRNDLATGTVGYLKKSPDMTRGAAGNAQEWAIVTERLDLIFGDAGFGNFLG
jgi:hypothetical protein